MPPYVYVLQKDLFTIKRAGENGTDDLEMGTRVSSEYGLDGNIYSSRPVEFTVLEKAHKGITYVVTPLLFHRMFKREPDQPLTRAVLPNLPTSSPPTKAGRRP